MSATKAFDLITRIAATGVRAEKEALLRELLDDEIGRFVVNAAYDPFQVFNITPPLPSEFADIISDHPFRLIEIQHLLKDLQLRNLTGNAALLAVRNCMENMTFPGRELLYRILSKDLKCGIGESTIQAVCPGLFPVFSVMRANTFEEKRIKRWPVVVEPKLDGFRYAFVCKPRGARFFSRTGKWQPSVDHMVEPMMKTAKHLALRLDKDTALYHMLNESSFVVDGEMLAGGNFNQTAGALRRESEEATDACFHIFDIMGWEEFDAVGTVLRPYSERRKMVEDFAHAAHDIGLGDKITTVPRRFVINTEGIMKTYGYFRSLGYEGAMVKIPEGGYDKKKSWGWMKVKPIETEDLRIIGYYPGEPNTKYEKCLGGLIVLRGDVEVDVGGGFSDAQRQEFWDQITGDFSMIDHGIIQRKSDGTARALIEPGDAGFTLLNNLAEIEYHEVTPAGSLRHPRFIRLRGDKLGEAA